MVTAVQIEQSKLDFEREKYRDEKEKFDFEREKWRAELSLRKKDSEIQLRDQRDRHAEVWLRLRAERRSRWTNPIVLAVFAAAIAAAGNAAVAWVNGYEVNRASVTKGEADRILEAIKTNNPDSAATNLSFLLDAGLIESPETKVPIEKYLKNRKKGEGATLPAIAATAPSSQQTVAITDTPSVQDRGKKVSSTDSIVDVQVSFLNLSHETLQLFWVDYNGQTKLYGEIPAGASSTISSFAGHVWSARSMRGAELLRYTVNPSAVPQQQMR